MRNILISHLFIVCWFWPGPASGQWFPKPTAAISGGGEICLGDSIRAYIYFTGFGPWDAVVNDKDGEYAELREVESPYTLWLKTEESNTYYVAEVRDRYGRKGDTKGEAEVVVYPRTPVEILMERTAFLYSEPGIQLYAEPAGGEFSGNGVTGGMFYPHIATPVGSPHRITYTYVNEHGCSSRDRIDLFVLYGIGEVFMVHGGDTVDMACNTKGTYLLNGSNQDGIPGTFELRVSGSSTVVPGHIEDEDLTDDTAYLDPSGLSGPYDIAYTYEFRELSVTTVLPITVEDLGSLQIAGLPDSVCKNDNPYLLTPDPDEYDPGATYLFSGPGVTGDQTQGFYFDPGLPEVPLGPSLITMDYVSSIGCEATVENEVVSRFVPEVGFMPAAVCLPEGGGTVSFNNQTTGKDSVQQWSWNFGDINSGSNNYSDLENPDHFYSEPGQRLVTLTATTREGCVASFELDTLFVDQPIADFTWISDCYAEGGAVTFINKSQSTFSEFEAFTWIFQTSDGEILEEIETGPEEDTIEFSFTSQDSFKIDLHALNSGGCSGSTARKILLKPTIFLNSEGYEERFNASAGGWSIQSDDQLESWVWDEPDFIGFEGDPGDRAWYTDLPAQQPGYTENSWVQSPCFDFSGMKRPMAQLDIMKSFVPNLTGAVFQYQDVIDAGWKTVGGYNEGIGWYNSNTIFNTPGGSSYGWGLNVFEPDTDWETARHDLDMLPGNARVKFRIVIGTNGEQGIGNQGFAFDNVIFAERTKRSVLEHFTNSADVHSRSADSLVDLYASVYSKDVIDLQYHMNYPGQDPMNMNNPDPPSNRAGNLGIGMVPYAVLDGGVNPAHRYDFSGEGQVPDKETLKLLSLEIPLFRISLAVDWQQGSLEATTTVTCNTDQYSSNIQLYVAVFEYSVTAYTGLNQDTAFRNVVLDMLPTPAGKLLGSDWYLGKSETRTNSWIYPAYLEDPEDLGVVAFVQDRDNDRILQASVRYKTPVTGIPAMDRETGIMELYPNPAREYIRINLGKPNSYRGIFEIMDISGRVIQVETVPPGSAVHQLDISGLSPGLYLIHWVESADSEGYAKFTRIH